jgi:hypothetical protein
MVLVVGEVEWDVDAFWRGLERDCPNNCPRLALPSYLISLPTSLPRITTHLHIVEHVMTCMMESVFNWSRVSHVPTLALSFQAH